MTRLLDFFNKHSLTKRLEKIKIGDCDERGKLIEEYIPFIIKTISNTTNKYIESENSDEYSIGIEAFNEAIDKYEFSKGSFINFAELVIKSRILDYIRKMSKHEASIPMSQFQEEEIDHIEKQLQTEDFTESFIFKHEIEEFETKLEQFNITFLDLLKEAPKHVDTRVNALRIAKYIVENEKLKEELMRKKTLPSTKLTAELGVTVKILKRSRKFIIAAVLILDSDLEQLKNYISQTKGGVINDL
ncbi:RNA polymerase sigma-I factor [Lutibacter sp. B2]|nr:RNA polymerase sigma-I factor [Lutibacter sp. B2]